MTNVLTLVAAAPFGDDDIGAFIADLKAPHIRRLSDRAVDIETACPLETLRERSAQAEEQGLDAYAQPTRGREKSVLIADMDSTIIGQECLDELADLAGCGEEIAAVTEQAMRGELDFDAALTARVAKLKGLPTSMIDRVLAERLTLNPGATTLVKTLEARGGYTALVSGGFTAFTAVIAEKVGFRTHRGNRLAVDEANALTGEVETPILGREAKRDALIEFCKTEGYAPDRAIAIGDGANDLAMIELAGLGIAYKAKPIVSQAADASIRTTDLTTVLYYLGFSSAEFVH